VEGDLHLRVATAQEAHTARRLARELARGIGFDAVGAEEVALAASELATNLVRYGRGGEIRLRRIDDGPHPGVQLESDDVGPGIGDVDQAMRDGFSSGGGLGSGLPAVRRLMDEFGIYSQPNGTHVIARKWLPKPSR
jgi:serine/threonine-protein kinase RsbT